jgi:hypothetical protein
MPKREPVGVSGSVKPALHPCSPDALRALARGFSCEPGQEGLALDALRRTVMALAVLAFAEARGIAIAPVSGIAGRGAWPRIVAALARGQARGGSLFDARDAITFARDADASASEAILALFGESAAGAWAELSVEPIVGAYEYLIGLDLRVATGLTLITTPHHRGVDLDALLATKPERRAAALAERTGAPTTARIAAAIERARSIAELHAALARRVSPASCEPTPRGSLYVEPGVARRRAGAHYTPRALTRPLIERALAPLFDRAGLDVQAILSLRVCDPAMGSGAFLVESCRQIADRVRLADPSIEERAALRLVAERCLYGVDADPLAVDLARAALWLLVEDPDLPMDFADARLAVGDALIGVGLEEGAMRADADRVASTLGVTPFHWLDAFPDVRARRGFDAVVGNPPWVAYAGRAAQPLDDARHDFYRSHYACFFGYRTLHALFVLRAASLLAPRGRLGLVVPTSISDLGGYAPSRRAHDALCEVDPELPDFGDAFDGVFQPSMGLLSTRRASAPPETTHGATWRVARDDLDPLAAALVERLSSLPTLPPGCFGERGFQTTSADAAKLKQTPAPDPPFVIPVREGVDVRAFASRAPRIHLDPEDLVGSLRGEREWREVRVLVRQTARFPIAARADGIAFRNSILAGFEVAPYDASVLVAYLNASPIRWLHFMRHRDARQGMPQVKIAHLRSIPRVPEDSAAHLAALSRIGGALGARNTGIEPEEQRALDAAVARAFALTDAERAMIAAWAASNPAP